MPPRPTSMGRSRVERIPGAAAQRAGIEFTARIPVSSEFVSEHSLLHEVWAPLNFDAIRVRGVRCRTWPVGSDIRNNAMDMIDRDSLYAINQSD